MPALSSRLTLRRSTQTEKFPAGDIWNSLLPRVNVRRWLCLCFLIQRWMKLEDDDVSNYADYPPPTHTTVPPSIMKHKLSLKPLQTLSVPVFVRPSPPRSVVLHNEQ